MDGTVQKKAAGDFALKYIEQDMVVGLGTGSTSDFFVRALGARVSEGLKITGVATSVATADLAKGFGIPLASLDDVPAIDVTVDGADEIDGQLRLIKGGGGALLREKVIAAASRRIVTIADQSKLVDVLGAYPLPIEIVDFAPKTALREIARVADEFGCQSHDVRIRERQGASFVTDGGHLIVDCACRAIPDPDGFAAALNALPLVVENGLFIGLSSVAVIGGENGIKTIERP